MREIDNDEIIKIDKLFKYNNYSDEYIDKVFKNEKPDIDELKIILKPHGFFWVD